MTFRDALLTVLVVMGVVIVVLGVISVMAALFTRASTRLRGPE